jgi:hypothetical protein
MSGKHISRENFGTVVAISPVERDRRMGILHPASLGLMELDLGAMVRQVAHLGLPVEPENLRQVFVAHLEARVAKRYCLWPTAEDFALITGPERLEALCEDFMATEEGQAHAERLEAKAAREVEPLPAPRLH